MIGLDKTSNNVPRDPSSIDDENIKSTDDDISVGKGNFTNNGEMPDSTDSGYVLPIGVMIATLNEFSSMLNETYDNLQVIIASLVEEVEENSTEQNKNSLELKIENQKTEIAEKQTQVQELRDAKAEAEAAAEEQSFFGWLNVAFQWVGVAVSALTTIGLAITGVGAPAACMMLAATIVQATMAADATTGAATGESIAVHFGEWVGMDEDTLKEFDLAMKITLAVVSMIYSVGMMAVPGGQVTAIANIVKAASSAASTYTQIASTAVGIVGSVKGFEATNLQADAKEKEADVNKIAAFLQMIGQVVDQLIAIITKVGETISNIMGEITKSVSDDANSAKRMRIGA